MGKIVPVVMCDAQVTCQQLFDKISVVCCTGNMAAFDMSLPEAVVSPGTT